MEFKIITEPLTQVVNIPLVPFRSIQTRELFSAMPKMAQLMQDCAQISYKPLNTITMKQLPYGKFEFYDGEKFIGGTQMGRALYKSAPLGDLPESWYIPNGVPNEANMLPINPILYITEFVIKDKEGLFKEYQKRIEGKKYGVMCMQKILEYAEQNGYGTRVSLTPSRHYSNIHPGRFYAQIGFEPGPNDITHAQKSNEEYYRGVEYVKEHPNLPEEIKKDFLNKTVYEQIDGRFVSMEGFCREIYLTHPEVLRNYPL